MALHVRILRGEGGADVVSATLWPLGFSKELSSRRCIYIYTRIERERKKIENNRNMGRGRTSQRCASQMITWRQLSASAARVDMAAKPTTVAALRAQSVSTGSFVCAARTLNVSDPPRESTSRTPGGFDISTVPGCVTGFAHGEESFQFSNSTASEMCASRDSRLLSPRVFSSTVSPELEASARWRAERLPLTLSFHAGVLGPRSAEHSAEPSFKEELSTTCSTRSKNSFSQVSGTMNASSRSF